MKIGLYVRLFGRAGTEPSPPSWRSIQGEALAAEAAGFDLVVLEDALLYPDDDGISGLWDAVSIAAAIATATETIGIGHAVINNPYRHPALVARIAETLDEISGGRYTLGIGLGNTPDDYPRFGIDADRRYSRFAEAIQIIHSLLRTGRVSFEGEFYRAPEAELILRGPRPDGPPIVIAGGKPKMLQLAARFADEWNWWTSESAGATHLQTLGEEVDRACEEIGRDPATLRRSVDLFSVATPGTPAPSSSEVLQLDGSPDQMADAILAYGTLGFDEIRCDLKARSDAPRTEAIAWMADVVARVHAA
jgi:alkanesulfonate monooxygenase SsuD/methylene tetrahydromethanopterin reductase-like flavin-dependent oxidoreductase (luciferase family)